MGKGSKPRPLSVPREQYETAWERTFRGGVGGYVRRSEDGDAKVEAWIKKERDAIMDPYTRRVIESLRK